MVAITILALSIAGPLYAASRAIIAAQVARDQLVASYLAQEGIEYVRAMRDNEYLAAYDAGGANVSDMAWSNFVSGTNPQNPGSIAECIAETCTLDPANPMGLQMGSINGNSGSIRPCGGSTGSACPPLYLSNNNIYTQQNLGTKTPFTRTIQAVTISASDERIISTVSWNFHNISYTVTVTDHLLPWQ